MITAAHRASTLCFSSFPLTHTHTHTHKQTTQVASVQPMLNASRQALKEQLVALLHPNSPLEHFIPRESLTQRGPPTLASLAATVLQGHLTASIHALAAAQQHPSQEQAVCSASPQQQGEGEGVSAQRLQACSSSSPPCSSSPSAFQAWDVVATNPCFKMSSSSRCHTTAPDVTPSYPHHSQQCVTHHLDQHDDEDTACGVCLDEAPACRVGMRSCPHSVCPACALQLVQQMRCKARPSPAPCPFCRVPISGFSAQRR